MVYYPFLLIRRKMLTFVTDYNHINKILTMNKKTLVLGASLKDNRYSNMAIKKLRLYNNSVVAIGLRQGLVGDVKILVSSAIKGLEEFGIEDINTITLYLNPKRQEAYYDYIISLNPKRVIFNPGTENEAFYELLEKNNIEYEVACTLVLLSINQF